MAKKSNRKKRRPVPVPVASMGDIAFLLIIFFLVCSEVTKDKADLQVTLPLSEYVKKSEASVAARVAVDETGQIFLDGVAVNSAKDVEWGVRAMLASGRSSAQLAARSPASTFLSPRFWSPLPS